ncbi:MAG TPA: hypothetical protein VM536_11085, partial [Chloroflexia bacterium]|nr:hypothetical protein [Chloroflexia bacterium]
MHTRCSLCYQWTRLPAHYPASSPIRPECEGCGMVLPGDSYSHRYAFCRVCTHCYLAEYATCPVCPPAADLAGALAWVAGQIDTRTPAVVAPLSDAYCRALWQSYQQEQAGAKDRVQPGASRASGNGYSRPTAPSRGNGSRAVATAPLVTAAATPAATGEGHAFLPTGPVALFEMDPIAVPAGNGNGSGHDGESAGPALRADEGLTGVEYELIQDSARLVEVADLLAAEPLLGVDTETDGLDPYTTRLLLLQVATPQKAYIVDCQRCDPLPLKPLLESGRTLKLLQNAKFDYKILKHIAGIELCNIFDTMLAERLLTAGRAREVSLRQLAMKYAGIMMDKTVRKSFIGARGDGYLSEAQLTYAARDALIMFTIYQTQWAEIKKQRMDKVAALEFQCVAAVGD